MINKIKEKILNEYSIAIIDHTAPLKHGRSSYYFSPKQDLRSYHKIGMKKGQEGVIAQSSLAHEYGHYLSWKNGYWSKFDIGTKAIIEEKNISLLSFKDRFHLFSEEVRAWKYAHLTLKELNFKNWIMFFLIAGVCLSTYMLAYFEIVFLSIMSAMCAWTTYAWIEVLSNHPYQGIIAYIAYFLIYLGFLMLLICGSKVEKYFFNKKKESKI